MDRNGREATKITTSGNITPYVTDSARVYDTSAGVEILDLDTPEDNENRAASVKKFRNKAGGFKS